jgi:VCBS repeat protein
MHVADVDGDGRNDVVAAAGHNYGVFWFQQGENHQWTRRTIDNAWSQGHASTLVDFNGDGQLDFVTGKRFMAHNGSDPGEREPLGLYWYQFRRPAQSPTPQASNAQGRGGATGNVEWIRHVISYGGQLGAGMQIAVTDIDADGDLDIVVGGKSGLFLVENTTKSARRTGK